MKSKIAVTLCLIFAVAILGNAAVFAASETEAVAYLVERGIYEGDENGNLNLDKTFTRAELAVILTRLDFIGAPGGLAEWRDWGMEHFALPENRYNKFTDLPEWALPYIEYCYEVSIVKVKGVTPTLFDPSGTVNPKMICTVILRWLRLPETDWDYGTAVAKARSLGLSPDTGLNGETISRAAVADMIYAALLFDEADAVTQLPESAPDAPQMSPDTPSEASPAVASMTIDEMKAEIVRLTNEERVKAGVPELEILPELMDCAQAKADDMYNTGYIRHTSPVYGTHNEMIRAYVPGVNGGWENLTVGPAATPREAIDAWLDSEGHRATMLEKSTTHIGVGIVFGDDGRCYWVQQFVKL
jgi:uncharacterized protein YkwD